MRTIIRGKRCVVPPPIIVPPKKHEKLSKLVTIYLNDSVYASSLKPSQIVGNLLLDMIPVLQYKSISSMLDALTTAEQLLTQISDTPLKPTKQIKGIRKLVENVREKTKDNPEAPDMREKLIEYITEHVMRCEGLGVLHGFMEVAPKRSKY